MSTEFYPHTNQSLRDWLDGVDAPFPAGVHATHARLVQASPAVWLCGKLNTNYSNEPHVGIFCEDTDGDFNHVTWTLPVPTGQATDETKLRFGKRSMKLSVGDVKYTVMFDTAWKPYVYHASGVSDDVLEDANIRMDVAHGVNVGTCYFCSAEKHELQLTPVEGDRLACESCADSVVHCRHCDEVALQTHGSIRLDDVCDDCFNNLYGYCEDCHDPFLYDNLNYVEGRGDVCDTCRADHYTTCRDCGRLVHYRDEIEGLCRPCREVISSYGPTHAHTFLPSLDPGTLYLGVELEVEASNGHKYETARNIHRSFDNFDLKQDGSLQNGFEIVSQPATLEYHINDYGWQEILSILRDAGFTSHDSGTCGIHIHVSRDAMTDWTEVKLAYFINMLEDFVTKFARRDYNSYAQKEHKRLEQGYNRSGSGHAATHFGQRTLEIRIFRGTLREQSFLATLEFVDALVDFCAKASRNQFEDNDRLVNDFIDYAEKRDEKYPHLYPYMEYRGLT